jgi:hypothetical protein
MSTAPNSQDDEADQEATSQAAAMQAKLRKDAASWSKARHDAAPADIGVPATLPQGQPPSPRPSRARKIQPAPPVATQAEAKPKRFSMSYGGATTADYIQYRIDRGAK